MTIIKDGSGNVVWNVNDPSNPASSGGVPTATSSALGVVKAGSGLAIDANGVLSVATLTNTVNYKDPSGNSVNLVTSLAEKVSSTNIVTVRDNASVFEYSLDGSVWKQVTSGSGSTVAKSYVMELARWGIKNDGTDETNT